MCNMNYEATVRYSEETVRSSVRAFWWKKLGKELFWAVPIAIVGIIMIYAAPEKWYYGAFFSGVCSIAILVIIAGYYVYLKRSLALFEEMGEESCVWSFNDEGFYAKSGIGETKLKWRVLKEILKFERFWLLIYMNGAYSTLPMDGIPQECKEFIEISHNKALQADAKKRRG